MDKEVLVFGVCAGLVAIGTWAVLDAVYEACKSVKNYVDMKKETKRLEELKRNLEDAIEKNQPERIAAIRRAVKEEFGQI